jgi:hypothetical protein
MSTPVAPHGEGLEVVVGADGTLTVAADELARHGVYPGAQVRLIPKQRLSEPKRRVRGALAGVIDAKALDAFETALDQAKADRIEVLEQRWP